MNEDRFQPFAKMGWFTCSICSIDVHKNLVYKPLKPSSFDYEYFCSQECYLEVDQENEQKAD